MIHGDRNSPPISKSARELARKVELAVDGMARRHKYRLGEELSGDARTISRACAAAWRDRDHKLDRVQALSEAVDNFRLTLQLAWDVRALASFGQFEDLLRTASSLGRQVGGWLRQLHARGQNQPANEPAGRAPILSSRAASIEAHP